MLNSFFGGFAAKIFAPSFLPLSAAFF